MKRKVELLMGALLLTAAFLLAKEGADVVSTSIADHKKVCIVVDAGHGGSDPGKVGVNGILEKEINLKIANKLKKELEKNKIKVVMTRKSDDGLYDTGTANKKVQDMRRRCEIISKADAIFTISIHQNSYPQEYVKGAQCFYYGQSEDGKQLAETLQESLRSELDPENKREAKANASYFLLKKTTIPTIIVECGFLSNNGEAAKLNEDDYQNKVSKALCKGIMKYISSNDCSKGKHKVAKETSHKNTK